jgi:hypothetical protein
MVADVTHTLIGIDVFGRFGLLVDWKHHRLLGRILFSSRSLEEHKQQADF